MTDTTKPQPSKPKSSKTTPPPIPIGLDIGYGHTKLATPDGEVTFPSLVAPIESGNALSCFYDPRDIVEVDEQRYLVGAAAIHAAFRFREQWDEWWASPAFSALLAKVKTLIPKGALIVTGIPLHLYNSESARHRIETITKRYLGAKDVSVLAQGIGAFLVLLQHRPSFSRSRLALVDIGSRTTELVGIAASSFVSQQSRGLVFGTHTIFQAIATNLSLTHGRTLDPFEIEAALQQNVPLTIRSHTISPEELREKHLQPHLEAFTNRLYQEMESLWGLGSPSDPTTLAPDFDTLVFCGGGSLLLQPLLHDRYPHAIIVEQAQLTNARGFYLMACQCIEEQPFQCR